MRHAWQMKWMPSPHGPTLLELKLGKVTSTVSGPDRRRENGEGEKKKGARV
jgi:hypothetical protein